MSNPILEAANEATGTEPLNTFPTEPVPAEQPSSRDEIPVALTSILPTGCEPVIFPLDLDSSKDSKENVVSLSKARKFENLIKAVVRPSGPARAEVGATSDVQTDAVDAVRKVVEGGKVKTYKVEVGMNRRKTML